MAEEEKTKEEEEKPKQRKAKFDEVSITQIVTQQAPAYKLPDESIVGAEEYLVWLGNQVLQIKRAVA